MGGPGQGQQRHRGPTLHVAVAPTDDTAERFAVTFGSAVVVQGTHGHPAKPSDTPSRKPNITLKSDLAFAINSATLSGQAKDAIDQIAQQVRDADLSGKIFVDGYTDNLGSAAYGVRSLEGARHGGVGIPRLAARRGAGHDRVVAHGEKDPIAKQLDQAGRQKQPAGHDHPAEALTGGRGRPGLTDRDHRRPYRVTMPDELRLGFVTGTTPDKWARAWRERRRERLELRAGHRGAAGGRPAPGEVDVGAGAASRSPPAASTASGCTTSSRSSSPPGST